MSDFFSSLTGAGNTLGNPGGSSAKTDTRLRLHAQNTSVYGTGVMRPLLQTSGLIFPYTPTVNISQDVDYGSMVMTHSNMDVNTYSRTSNTSINITGQFSVQNQSEGKYTFAALHFLRTVSKMHFGETDPNAGLPPPILLLSGYGTQMFNATRVILKTHSYSFEETKDLVEVTLDNGSKVKLPALFSVQMQLVTQPTATAMRKEFNLEEFRSGALLEKGGWF